MADKLVLDGRLPESSRHKYEMWGLLRARWCLCVYTIVFYTQLCNIQQGLLRAGWYLCVEGVHKCILYIVYTIQGPLRTACVWTMYTQLFTIQGLLRSDSIVFSIVYYSIVYTIVYNAESVESCWLVLCICVHDAYRSCGSGAVYSDENCILCVLIHCIVYIVHSRDPYTSSLEKRDLYTSSLESRVVCSAERSSLCRWPWLTISSVALAVLLLKQWPF